MGGYYYIDRNDLKPINMNKVYSWPWAGWNGPNCKPHEGEVEVTIN